MTRVWSPEPRSPLKLCSPKATASAVGARSPGAEALRKTSNSPSPPSFRDWCAGTHAPMLLTMRETKRKGRGSPGTGGKENVVFLPIIACWHHHSPRRSHLPTRLDGLTHACWHPEIRRLWLAPTCLVGLRRSLAKTSTRRRPGCILVRSAVSPGQRVEPATSPQRLEGVCPPPDSRNWQG